MSPGDTAGVVGTWVAAFIAIVALVGVLGPLLVWRASRTARNQALSNLETGFAETGGFISPGVRLGPRIRLFRHVKAPILHKLPRFVDTRLQWDVGAVLPSKESASWIQLGAVLHACGLPYSTGDVINIEDGAIVLPVSRVWLYVLGLVGRFGKWADQGKLATRLPKGLGSKPARPGDISASWTSRPPTPGWMTSRPDWARPDYSQGSSRTLSGLFGIMSFHTHSSSPKHVSFIAHAQSQIGQLDRETLALSRLFWLSVGCLPLKDGRVLSLENVQFVRPPSDSEPEELEEVDVDVNNDMLPGMSPAVRWTPSRGYKNYDHDYEPDRHRKVRFNDAENTSPAFVTPTSRIQSDLEVRQDWGAPRKFRFAVTEDRSEPLIDIADALGADTNDTLAMSLEECIVSEDESKSMRADTQRTYVPRTRTWVRLSDRSSFTTTGSWFLERSSAQLLARALLELPLCGHGYLIYRPVRSVCRDMLVAASESLPRLLSYVMHNVEHLGLDKTHEKDLLGRLYVLFKLTENFRYRRPFPKAVYELDEALADVLRSNNALAGLSIQVLAITSPEFREIVSGSLHNFEDCVQAKVTLDMQTSTVNVNTSFGVVQKFPIDLESLVARPDEVDTTAKHVLSYPMVILLMLKGCLRSAFLDTSLDSLPLFNRTLELNEVVNVTGREGTERTGVEEGKRADDDYSPGRGFYR